MKTIQFSMIAVGLMAACSSTEGADPRVGNDVLGISQFVTTETTDRVHLQGVDALGRVRAELTLRRGFVAIPDEGMYGDGRELIIDVGGATSNHASLGYDHLSLPVPEPEPVATLLDDPYVSSILERWGISIVAPELGAVPDFDYAHGGACTYSGCGGNGTTSCCQQHASGGFTHQKIACGWSHPASRSERSCSSPDAPTACGTAGSLGCKVCWGPNNYDPLTTGWRAKYTAGTDTCAWEICKVTGQSCTSDAQCCQHDAQICYDGQCLVL